MDFGTITEEDVDDKGKKNEWLYKIIIIIIAKSYGFNS